MRAVVWYASWQMECCGDPFAVGDEVAWTVEDEVNDEWFVRALDAGTAASITHVEEHHSDDERLERIAGRVLSIRCAWSAFGPAKAADRVHVPLAGSARLVESREAGRARPDTFADLQFNGWLVELELSVS